MADRTIDQLRAEVDEVAQAMQTAWKDLTIEQHEVITGSVLTEVAGKSLNVSATFDALRRWLA